MSEACKKEQIRVFFTSFDTTGDGLLEEKEIWKVLLSLGFKEITAEDICEYFSKNDKNNDKKISFEEFYSVFCKRDKTEVKESEVKEFFQSKDKDNSGFLERKEVAALLTQCEGFSEETLQADLDRSDKNGDGKIDYKEFLKAFYAK